VTAKGGDGDVPARFPEFEAVLSRYVNRLMGGLLHLAMFGEYYAPGGGPNCGYRGNGQPLANLRGLPVTLGVAGMSLREWIDKGTEHICGQQFHSCRCGVAAGTEHDLHVCKCGGSWRGEPGSEWVVQLPHGPWDLWSND